MKSYLPRIATFALLTWASHSASAVLIDFDDINGEIGDHYRPLGATFTLGDGEVGTSTLDTGVSAWTGNFGTSVSSPNVLIPSPGSNLDIYVNFYTATGKGTVNFVAVRNDAEGRPAAIMQAFSEAGSLLGQTDPLVAGQRGTIAASGIAYVKIAGQIGSPGSLGVDDFEFSQPVPEPAAFAPIGLAALALLRRRKGR